MLNKQHPRLLEDFGVKDIHRSRWRAGRKGGIVYSDGYMLLIQYLYGEGELFYCELEGCGCRRKVHSVSVGMYGTRSIRQYCTFIGPRLCLVYINI